MMYWVDTNVVSETRKMDKASPGVRQFFKQANPAQRTTQ
jgi:predicted nucleic acid-binding protein